MSGSRYLALATLLAASHLVPSILAAQNDNYPDRRALVVNVCPAVELSAFSYANQYDGGGRGTRFHQNLTWKNIGTQPVVAFEIVILKYDAFNQRLIGSRWTVTGKNSGDWRPFAPGTSDQDGTLGYGEEEVYTAVAYVRTARLSDGSVWHANQTEVLQRLDSKYGYPRFRRHSTR
jgi:hypothetical protein